MKRKLCLMLSVAVLLGGFCLCICAEAEGPEAYFGLWAGDGVRARIWREDDVLRCRFVFVGEDGDSDVWAYDNCWYDAESGVLQCGCVTRTHEHYDALWDTLEETDWSLNDMPFADIRLSENGIRLTDDDKLEAPIELKRLEAADAGEWAETLAFLGRWEGEFANLRVEDHGVAYLFTVAVPLDAEHTGKWTYTCRYDADGKRMVSVDVSNRSVITPTEEGGTIEEEVGRVASEAVFTLGDDGKLVWSDVTDGDGEDMTLERVPE